MLKKLSIAVSTTITTLAVVQSAQAATLINGGFETPNPPPGKNIGFPKENRVPGWETSATNHKIEIWTSGTDGVPAYEGNQFLELNGNQLATVFQDVRGIAAGLEVGFEFAHRARVGTDVMNLTITDLGDDNILGGGNDTILFTNNYSATTAGWVVNTNAGEAPIITLGNNLRFAYDSVSTGSGSPTKGNFIDDVSFGVGVGAVNSPAEVPEPATILGLLAVGALGATSLKLNNDKKV